MASIPSLHERLVLHALAGKEDASQPISVIDALLRPPQASSHHGLEGQFSARQSSRAASSSSDWTFVHHYDHIIVGSGMGGGMLARKLITDGLKVLVIEKGQLEYLTHCLNTSRPHFDHKSESGPGRDNELVFNMVQTKYNTDTVITDPTDPSFCGGGSFFGVGGRSLFWSLETPEIVKTAADANFPADIVNDLYDQTIVLDDIELEKEGWYTKAARILANSPPGDIQYASASTATTAGTAKLDSAVSEYQTDISVAVPQGAEFSSGVDQYYFPESAYSTADWLLDHMYNRKREDPPSLAIGFDVVKLGLNEKGTKATHITFTFKGDSYKVKLDDTTIVTLAAGTVNTAAIALGSEIGTGSSKKAFKTDHTLVGQGLTDHEIWMARYHSDDMTGQPLELSCHVNVNNHPALLTICIHAEKFYGHGFATGEAGETRPGDDDVNVLNVMLEFEAPLNEQGEVKLGADGAPVISINRTRLDDSKDFDDTLEDIVTSIRDEFGYSGDAKPKLSAWGAVAHEVGTMRVDRPGTSGTVKGVVDSDLKVHGVSNLYVCDLSVFPFSPMANPSRTLTALAMRLADHFGSS